MKSRHRQPNSARQLPQRIDVFCFPVGSAAATIAQAGGDAHCQAGEQHEQQYPQFHGLFPLLRFAWGSTRRHRRRDYRQHRLDDYGIPGLRKMIEVDV